MFFVRHVAWRLPVVEIHRGCCPAGGVAVARAPSEEKQQQQSEQRAAARSGGADPLFGADLPLSAIQSTVAKLTLKASGHWRVSSSPAVDALSYSEMVCYWSLMFRCYSCSGATGTRRWRTDDDVIYKQSAVTY